MTVLFEGEDMAAVRHAAMGLAKKLNCEEESACGLCLSCRTFESGNHPDIFFVKGTKAVGIGVEDAREQIALPITTKPFKYRYKIFIIEGNITPQAQNALLKTIEEPAPYGVFLFLAKNTFGFLPTILSRCIVKKIRGSEFVIARELAEKIADSVKNADIPKAFGLYKEVESLSKEELNEFLDALYVIYGKRRNFDAVDAITKTKQIISQNGNLQLAIELMLYKMA
ncbi:MAG: hypothetical protein FWF78_08975 [Defluviitaleaceae bacterium]|nr:hypothetical protein [Defluviitaleaceae bacterium]